ncbi:hypothetical protein J599_0269 [Acinetobacter baumannii 1598530]|nr:hypothetical protein J599_0269 [Acinetobacter baumannii 1598530]CAI3104217.1 hypothetical protein MWMV4_MWMV4_00291 [Acinetobacter baumannii]
MQAFLIKFFSIAPWNINYCFGYKNKTCLGLLITQQLLYLEYLAWFAF